MIQIDTAILCGIIRRNKSRSLEENIGTMGGCRLDVNAIY